MLFNSNPLDKKQSEWVLADIVVMAYMCTVPAGQGCAAEGGRLGRVCGGSPEALVKAGVEGVAGGLLGVCITARHDWLDQLYEDITQLILPEAVQRLQAANTSSPKATRGSHNEGSHLTAL